MISEETQKLQQDMRVELFEVDASELGIGVLRFTPTSVSGASLFFGGHEYKPAAIKAEGFSWSSGGTLPRPTLELSVPDMAFISLLLDNSDLIGCQVTRLRTYRKYLDDGTHPNPTAVFAPEVYDINKKTSQIRSHIAWELTPKMDREGRRVPALQVIRDTCRHSFRKWNGAAWVYTGVTCPYAGSALIDANGEITGDPAKAQCGKRLSDCSAHFGKTAVLPFRGFPGVGRI